MRTANEIVSKLKEHQPSTPSKWRENADWRMPNRPWLRSFYRENIDDLASYFKITDVNQAIYDTIEDSERLQCLIMDISPDADLDKIFRPLETSRTPARVSGPASARLRKTPKQAL